MNGRRACAAVAAALGTLAFAPAANAADPPLIVDDDKRDCPAAPYTTIQNAIFAAPDGATIAVCPGTYVEGGGGVGTNGLIIIRDVNIKGAGADLVTIKPNKVRASTSQIAENTPNLRNDLGAIVMIDGADTAQAAPLAPANDQNAAGTRRLNRLRSSLLTVNISGVTIDGDGVYSEGGVLFRDAQGRITQSRITNIVTTETSYDSPRPGEYKGSNDGYAVASITAPPPPTPDPPTANDPLRTPDTAPLPTMPRRIQIDHTRIDKYNSAGVLLDGARGDTLPLTASGITATGILGQNQIIGRTLCVNFEVNGNCQTPAPAPATNGPLYGQDAVRVTAGSTLNMVDTIVSQNLTQGTGAPVRNSATNNAELWRSAGVRLLGAGPSLLTRNNIVNNGYGVFNAQLDGTTANTPTPVRAENNWWGLRGAAGTLTNPGPAISPTTNPPTPENPVNGAPVADPSGGNTSDAVDFVPFRNGPQSDPNTGEFPIVNVPGQVNDSAPTVTLATDKDVYGLGDRVILTAGPGDDFGVRRVTFYDGPWEVGSADRPPYRISYELPTDVACSTRTLTAVVTDSAGQTAAASKAITINAADCVEEPPPTPQPDPGPPSISPANPPRSLSTSGSQLTFLPVAPAGVKQVEVFLGERRQCVLTAAPYTCRVQPTGEDVGVQVVRAVVVDLAGRTAETSYRVEVPRFAPRSVSISIKTQNRSRGRVTKTITAEVKLPSLVTAAQGCSSGSITLVTKRGGRIIDDSQLRLSRSCRVTKRITTTRRGPKFSTHARFGGNRVLLPASSKTRRFS